MPFDPITYKSLNRANVLKINGMFKELFVTGPIGGQVGPKGDQGPKGDKGDNGVDGQSGVVDPDILQDYDDKLTQGLEQQALIEAEVNELKITKGSVARYTVKAISTGVASRDGELIVNSQYPADVDFISFAPFDTNSKPTKPAETGDIIEFVEPFVAFNLAENAVKATPTKQSFISKLTQTISFSGSSVSNVGDITRYQVTSGGNSSALSVKYLGGANTFDIGRATEVYIYPQNEQGASQDYVDERVDTKIGKAGQQTLEEGEWRIKQPRATGGIASYIIIDSNKMTLANLADPVDHNDAATKAYVDQNDSSGNELKADITYVDAQDAEVMVYVNEHLADYQQQYRDEIELVNAAKLDKAGGDMTGAIDMGSNDIKATGDLDTYTATIGVVRIFSNTISGYGGTLQLASQVIVKRVGNEKAGFTIRGEDILGYTNALFEVYHNPLGTLDAINYYGTTANAQTIQTKESVQGLFRDSARELTADVEAQFAVRDALIEKQGKVIKSLTERICKLEK